MKTTEKVAIDELLKRADALIKEGKEFLSSEGKVLEMNEWLTISEYADKYQITNQIVSKWIERGIDKEENYVEIGKFGKKFVRNIAYKA